ATDHGKNHVEEWPRKLNVKAKAGHEILIKTHCNGDDPLVIKADIGGTMIHRIYVDGGSLAEIL
ncbi:hypothetical protein Tco_0342355, partial [Tanacetum coccineum]